MIGPSQALRLPAVTAHLHGGPRDGETVQLPWARIDLPLIRWEDDVMVTDAYRLNAPWRGQSTAHYSYIEPAEKAA